MLALVRSTGFGAERPMMTFDLALDGSEAGEYLANLCPRAAVNALIAEGCRDAVDRPV
jgi:hypothetical protein